MRVVWVWVLNLEWSCQWIQVDEEGRIALTYVITRHSPAARPLLLLPLACSAHHKAYPRLSAPVPWTWCSPPLQYHHHTHNHMNARSSYTEITQLSARPYLNFSELLSAASAKQHRAAKACGQAPAAPPHASALRTPYKTDTMELQRRRMRKQTTAKPARQRAAAAAAFNGKTSGNERGRPFLRTCDDDGV